MSWSTRTHTHTHTHTHTQHAYMHTYIHTRAHTRTYNFVLTKAHIHTNAQPLQDTNIRVQTLISSVNLAKYTNRLHTHTDTKS